MSRYFIELFYKGTRYSGFQVQQNANSIQAEVEKALLVLQKERITLTGSSRTDAGVHALQNFFHFDYEGVLHPQLAYKLNAILPPDIVIKRILSVQNEAHSRFDAVSREYRYYIYHSKNPFNRDRAFYFPYPLRRELMDAAAGIIQKTNDFASFSKRNTQVKNFHCEIMESNWWEEGEYLVYRVKGNRFLRGMVRALVATMLKIGREKMTLDEFSAVIESRDCTKATFAVPAHGLFLFAVNYPEGYFSK